MPNHPRPDRVAIRGARVQLLSALADVVNVSRTGVLMHAGHELLVGSEHSLVLELNTVAVRLMARVVRCAPAQVPLPGGALHRRFAVAVTFTNVSAEAQAAIDRACAAVELSGC